jgi:hypothetical protein
MYRISIVVSDLYGTIFGSKEVVGCIFALEQGKFFCIGKYADKEQQANK